MADRSSIEWTDATWNPIRGCSPVSPGCVNCYAERMAARNLPGMNSPTTGEPFAIMTPSGPRWTGKVELIPHMLEVPLKRRKPTTYFVNSMSDLFHEGLSFEDIDRVFAVMALCQQHTFQILTKRSKRLREYFKDLNYRTEVVNIYAELKSGLDRWKTGAEVEEITGCGDDILPRWPMPLPNVWLGVSVEDQRRADERIPDLLATPAAVRFLSVEPLLGPVNLRCVKATGAGYLDTLDGIGHDGTGEGRCLTGEFLDWVIVGGESGPGARPCNIAWIRSIVEQCKRAGVPCFVKQLGAAPFEMATFDVKLRDRKGGDMEEWPVDLRVRQMPKDGAPSMRPQRDRRMAGVQATQKTASIQESK